MAEASLSIRSSAAINGIQELLDVGFGPDAFLDFAAREVELVAPVRHAGFHDGFEGSECFCWGPVGRADGEEVRDKVGVPEGGSVGDGSSLFFYTCGEFEEPCLP